MIYFDPVVVIFISRQGFYKDIKLILGHPT